MTDLSSLLGPPVTDPEEDAFIVFSQAIPSQSLGFIDAQAAEVEITVGEKDLTIRQSRGLLTSNRKEGTTGAVVWRVTPRFAEWISTPNFLFQHGFLGSESVVVELGAGIAGVVALLLAPKVQRYIATDQDYVLKLLRENISSNLLLTNTRKPKAKKKSSVAEEPHSNIDTLELDWELDSVASLPPRLRLEEGQGLDLIIACDCIYNEALIEPLNTTCAQLCRLRTAAEKPTLCLVAQQLRSHDVFEAWLTSFHQKFHVWQLPDTLLTAPLRENSGFIVHVGIVR